MRRSGYRPNVDMVHFTIFATPMRSYPRWAVDWDCVAGHSASMKIHHKIAVVEEGGVIAWSRSCPRSDRNKAYAFRLQMDNKQWALQKQWANFTAPSKEAVSNALREMQLMMDPEMGGIILQDKIERGEL
jgi:hypothetical protein